MVVESNTYILEQCKKAESLVWKVIFDLQILISELECNSELVDNLDNTLYQLYVIKGKLDCYIDEFSVQQDYNRLVDNLLEAKEELDRSAQRVQIIEATNCFREKQETKVESQDT